MTKSMLATVSLTFAAAALTSAPAQADDAPRCLVEVRRAPDEVRVAIEQWLAGERHCGLPLVVRVIADEGRLFVLAHDDRGRIFEREVPDAESVAALVASWAAPAEAGAGPAITSPGFAPVSGGDDDDGAAVVVPRVGRPRGWVGVGASVGERDSVGLGASGRYEALRSGRWSGAATAGVGVTSSDDQGMTWQSQAGHLGVAVAWTVPYEAWRGRAHLDLGWSLGRSKLFDQWSAWGTGGYVGAGADVERHLGGRWSGFVGISAGVGRQTIGAALKDMTDFDNDQRYVSGSAGVSTSL